VEQINMSDVSIEQVWTAINKLYTARLEEKIWKKSYNLQIVGQLKERILEDIKLEIVDRLNKVQRDLSKSDFE
jgi:hypothetical protein